MYSKRFKKIVTIFMIVTMVMANVNLIIAKNIEKAEGKRKQYIVKELVEERTENTDTYLLSDGSRKVKIYSDKIRYKDNGKLLDYDSSLKALNKDEETKLNNAMKNSVSHEYIAVNKQGDSKQYFSKKIKNEDSIVMCNNKYILSFSPKVNENTTKDMIYTSQIEGNKITYSSPYSNIKYEYISLNDGVKENIILESEIEKCQFKFDINSEELILKKQKWDGSISLLDKKTKMQIGYIMTPYIIDGEGNIDYKNVKYKLKKENNKTTLIVVINKKYFNNENLKYPITIDPTARWFSTKLSTASVINISGVEDSNLHSTVLGVENGFRQYDSGLKIQQRAYLDTSYISTGDAFVGAPATIQGKHIENATICITENGDTYYNAPVGTIEIKSPKTEWDVNTITWNNQPQINDKTWAEIQCTGVEQEKHTADITEWVQKIADNKIENNGLVFLAKESGTRDAFYGPEIQYGSSDSGNIPLYMYIEITYRDKVMDNISIVEYNYVTKEQNTINYQYDTLLNNEVVQCYIPNNLSTIEETIQSYGILPGGTLYETDNSLYPYTTIVHLGIGEDTNSDGIIDKYNQGASGFMIGPNVLVTAGHCVMDDTNDWTENMKIYTKFNGSYQVSNYNIIKIICPSEYVNTNSSNYDWAILIIDEDIGKEIGWLGFGIIDSLLSTPITVSGYAKLSTDNYALLYRDNGQITNVTEKHIQYNVSSYGGISGSPVFNEQNIALGIHTFGATSYNGGIKMSPYIFSLLLDKREEGMITYGYE